MSESLKSELAAVLNRYSMENASNTPDFILAEYLVACLAAWNGSITMREKWYGREVKVLSSVEQMTNSGEIGTGPYHPEAER